VNNRQKAKHFKQLYERTRTNFAPIKYETLPLKHYKAQIIITRSEVMGLPEHIVEQEAADRLLAKLKPLVKSIMYCDRDIERDNYRCTIDLWVK
jgi:hypothetical protein